MRKLSADRVSRAVASLCLRANFELRQDVLRKIKEGLKREKNKTARGILEAVIRNADIAKKERLAICQDTGLPQVFLEVGQDLKITGDLDSAVNKGIEAGYRAGFLRRSVVRDPLSRGKTGYTPAIIHTRLVKGSRLKVTVLPKGFGCENKTRLKMFKPTAGLDGIKGFVIESVKLAGPDACPPYVVGVGIGGTADYACLLAKKVLLRKGPSPKGSVLKLERDLLKKLNKLNIGPMGLGGRTTALAVNIETYPTHIAGLPVAVNISCHALRSASVTL
ncbi:MAG: fumarate hydratase [Candidatus Omnitrophica bacterium]|nr:fumarate hydratase [Candidatus Omnitrophota bacterium]